MHRYWFVLTLSALFSFTAFARPANPEPPSPNWDRALAVFSANTIDRQQTVDRLLQLAFTDTAAAIDALNQLRSHSEWPEPAKEAALYELVQQLRQAGPDSVDTSVLRWLQQYPNKVLVPHQEGPSLGIPMFNIRAAAQGIENQWARESARLRALNSDDLVQLLQDYLATPDPLERKGIEDAIASTGSGTAEAMLNLTISRLADSPQLAPLAGRAAVTAGRWDAIAEVIEHGDSRLAAPLLRLSAAAAPPRELHGILEQLIQQGSAETASLAIGLLTAVTIHQPATRQLLLQQLSDEALGSATALAIARHGNAELQQAMQAIAENQGDDAMAARIRLATELAVEQPLEDLQ